MTVRDDGVVADLAVVGLGAMGSATTFHAQRAGFSVIGFDRYDPPHQMGSSHAESRVTRLAVGEGPQYLPFVARSHEIWRQLEAETGTRLLYECGGLIISPERGPTPDPSAVEPARWDDFVGRTASVAARAGLDYERLTTDEAALRFPPLRLADGARIGFEPTGGVVLSERAVETQLATARRDGAVLSTNDTVRSIEPDADGVTIVAASGRHRARAVVVTAGAWIDELAGGDLGDLSVTRQLVLWFEPDDPAMFSVERFPFVIWVGERPEDYLGVFPMPPGGVPGVKILTEQFLNTVDPRAVSRTVTDAEVDDFVERFVGSRVRGLSPRCVQRSVCLYTNTADDHFVIDRRSDDDRILLASPCSGHGFKHSTALGEAMAQLMTTGDSDLDLSIFARRNRSQAPTS